MKFFSSAILLVVLSLVRAQEDPKQTGNCVSGKIGFNPDRILNNQANSSKIDETKYDMTIDYAASNVVIGPNGANLMLTKIGDGSTAAQGVRMSTTRYIHYGRFSVEMAAIPVGGVVTTFITMSPVQDEIDWEITGPKAHTNVFYKGIHEYSVWDRIVQVDDVSKPHVYTIDWKRDSLQWIVDGKVLRTHYKNATSKMTPKGKTWFPDTPTQIQISVWDGGASKNEGTRDWAGGPINWANQNSFYASYKYIEIQCYDDKDMPVKSWPPQPEGVTIDFAAGNETVNGTAISVIDKNGRIRSRNSASSATASFIALLAIVALSF